MLTGYWPVLVGLTGTLAIYLTMLAMSLTLVSYAVAAKRTSALFGVLIGWMFFGEKHFKERLLGSFVCVIGVAVMYWSS